MTDKTIVEAIVTRVIKKGKHGLPYFVCAACDKSVEGSITATLDFNRNKDDIKRVWQDNDWPEPGNFVLVWDLRKKVYGWRAHKARFLRIEDEKKG